MGRAGADAAAALPAAEDWREDSDPDEPHQRVRDALDFLFFFLAHPTTYYSPTAGVSAVQNPHFKGGLDLYLRQG